MKPNKYNLYTIFFLFLSIFEVNRTSVAAEPIYPKTYGVYVLDQNTFTRLTENSPGPEAEDGRHRTFSKDMKILVFEKWLSDPVANVNSIVILDWRSIGEHPMLQICASSKPVGGESDMTMIIPDQPMNQGLYTVEIGSRAHDYQFGVQTPDIASYWEEVLKERPTSWQAHNHFGAIMYMQGNTEAAYRHFIEAVHLNNTNPEIHVNLGLALDRMGKANAAIEQFGTAVQLANDSAIYTDLGNVYLEVKRYSDAVKAYQHAIQLNADIAPAYCNLGYALMQQGKVDDAILEFRKAVEIDPNLSQAQTNLNEALHRKTTNLDQK